MNGKKILAALLTATVMFSAGCSGKIKTGKVMQEETPYAYVVSQLGADVMPVMSYIAPMGEEAEEKAFVLTDKLRKAGVITETDHMGRGIKAQFKYADKIGAEYVGVIGSDELSRGEIKLKKMSDGTEISVSFDNLAEYFGKKPI